LRIDPIVLFFDAAIAFSIAGWATFNSWAIGRN